MKYAIQLNMYHYDSKTDKEYESWVFVGVDGKWKIFVMDDEVTDKTKLFKNATEAGEYLDMFFGPDKQRASYSSARIVEVIK